MNNKCLNAGEITASVTALANVMSKKLTVDELNLLSSVFLMLGDNLAAIAAVRTLNEKICDSDNSKQS
ncbi:MAG: hypothetical protein FWH20_02515 [Oscillospiraceae bacterium]|nr:hypothetical protein [Oscillospiraceae bacterium]